MTDDDADESETCFGKDALSIRDVLEELARRLSETGQDEMIFATRYGCWTWNKPPN
jgi:hypothetical protein